MYSCFLLFLCHFKIDNEEKNPQVYYNWRFHCSLSGTGPPTCLNKTRHLPTAPQQVTYFSLAHYLFFFLFFSTHTPSPRPAAARLGNSLAHPRGEQRNPLNRGPGVSPAQPPPPPLSPACFALYGSRRAQYPHTALVTHLSQPPRLAQRPLRPPGPPWILIPGSHVPAVTKRGLTAATSPPHPRRLSRRPLRATAPARNRRAPPSQPLSTSPPRGGRLRPASAPPPPLPTGRSRPHHGKGGNPRPSRRLAPARRPRTV